MKSISYYLTLLVIRLKGVKKEFSQTPIDYKKLRKENVPAPNKGMLKDTGFKKFKILGSEVSEIHPEKESNKLIIYCHGGAFVYGPVDYHWDTALNLSKKTGSVIWMINYPKAPENNIEEISRNIDRIYATAKEKHPLKKVILAGDSVGGTLMTTLVQRLVLSKQVLPDLLILISPVMDSSFSNPEIEKIDSRDPILSRAGALSAKKMASAGLDLKDPILSPLYGSFKSFPPTLVFIAENDITRPDQELVVQQLKDQNLNFTTIFGKGMPHIWPILPVMKEARIAFAEIIQRINELAR